MPAIRQQQLHPNIDIAPHMQQYNEAISGGADQDVPLNGSDVSSASPQSIVHGSQQAHALAKRRTNYATATDNSGGPAFSQTKKLASVYAGRGKDQEVLIDIQARIDKGFFLHDNDWTCYRRNYFQVSGCFNMGFSHTGNSCDAAGQYVAVGDKLYKISGYRMGLSAHMLGNEKAIGLVQHTSKRDKGPQMNPLPKALNAGGSFSSSHYQDVMMAVATPLSPNQTGLHHELPISTIATFERLQFKSATANNGKRRAAQQYFAVNVELYAQYENLFGGNDLIKVASITSTCLVVRGRSPSHYSESNEKMKSPYSAMTYGAARDNSDAYLAQSSDFSNTLLSSNMNHHLVPEHLPQFDYAHRNESSMMNFNQDVFASTVDYKPTIIGDAIENDHFGMYGSPLSTASRIDASSFAGGELPSAGASVPYLLIADHYSPLQHELMNDGHGGFVSHSHDLFQQALDF